MCGLRFGCAALVVLVSSIPGNVALADENENDQVERPRRKRPSPPPRRAPDYEPEYDPEYVDDSTFMNLGFRFGVSTRSLGEGSSARVLVPDFHFGFWLFDDMRATVDWGIAGGTLSLDEPSVSATSWQVGNPSLGLHYMGFSGGSFAARIGAAFTAPVASVGDGMLGEDVLALATAPAMDGGWDAWRWTPEVASVSLPVLVGWAVAEGFLVDLDVEPAVVFSTASEAGSTEAVVQTAIDTHYHIEGLTLGLRWQAVLLPTLDNGDKAQLSAVPYLRVRFDDTSLGLRMVLNLDEPSGFAFDDGGVWGFWASLGFAL